MATTYMDSPAATLVVIRGRAGRFGVDPLADWRDRDARLVKTLPASDLPATVTRWLALGRTIEGVVAR